MITLSDLVFSMLLALVAVLVYLLIPMIWGAGYAPSPKRKVAEVLRYVVDKYLGGREDLEIIDLGSGFGGVCFEAAKLFSRARCTGVDIDPLKIAWSRAVARLKRLSERVRFVRGNILDMDLGEYDLVYMYLWQPITHRIEEKIIREAKKKVVIVSYHHSLKKTYVERRGKFYIGIYPREEV